MRLCFYSCVFLSLVSLSVWVVLAGSFEYLLFWKCLYCLLFLMSYLGLFQFGVNCCFNV